MSKVLGFTNNGGEDWFNSSPYGNKEIQGISDPEGGHAMNAPTSIPSPFARMDLIRKSFENIVESKTLEFMQQGKRVMVSKEDEKMVSHCLDLAEMLFFYHNYKNSIEIIEWDMSTQINSLKSSPELGHKRLGEALDLYLKQDALTFNFDAMKSIYIIKYNHQVIGGTSPLTLFFPTAKDISGFGLKSSKGTTFFKEIIPLYKRDENFQKYLYLLFKNNPQLGERMKAFQEYLNKSLEALNKPDTQKLFSELNSLNTSDLASNYTDLNSGIAGHSVEVLGVSLKTIDPNVVVNTIKKSSFIIHSLKTKAEKKPLILNQGFNKPLTYVNSVWDGKTEVPYLNTQTNAELRILPGHDIIYPYLTISDFLEPSIIRLVYPINSEKYFDGNLKLNDPEGTKSYLLPVKPLFFEYFDAEDLVGGGIGKPSITIEESAISPSVRVLLKIPINAGKDYITFDRTYHNDGFADPSKNKGAVNEHQFGITLFPFIKYAENIAPFYKVQLIDRDVLGEFADADYGLKFYSNNSKAPVVIETENSRGRKQRGEVTKVGSKNFSLKHSFDYIQVDNKFSKGIIIPKWNVSSNAGDQFTFAIDFGTTNSHVEFSRNNSAPRPFEIKQEEIQAVSLVSDKTDHNFSQKGAIDIRTSIIREFVPEMIGKDTPYNFPHRTTISQSKTNAPVNGGTVLNDFNIPFSFEKYIDINSNFFTNLKWNNREPNNDFRVRAFIEELILLIRNKVILNGGDLETTKIIWTYPTSMSTARKNSFQDTWDELFETYINSHDKPIDICESIAPYYYFKGNALLQGSGFGVSVLMDIGGGTSDVVVYTNNVPELISSYKFAGNTLFGDGYKEFGNISNNQMVNRYKEDYDKLLSEGYSTLQSIADNIHLSQKTSDYNAFLFSLSNNFEIKQKELFDYNKKLGSDRDLKIIFIYFYAAKIYHIAQLMKVNKIDLPMNIIFSGNGSKVLNIITSDKDLITSITKTIFLKVYNEQEYPSTGLKINIEKEFPKEVTCKGALMHHKQEVKGLNIKDIKRTFTCVEDQDIFELLNGQLNDDVFNKVVAQVEDFNEMFISLNETYDFEDHFDISPASFSKFKEIVNNHLKSFLKDGIEFNNRMDGISPQPETRVSETLFFYPMVETIQKLIEEIAVLKPNN